MPQDHERFMRMALDEAAKGGAEGNAAIGSVVVRGDSLIAKGRNLVTSTHDLTAHAETVALRKAGTALGHVDLSGCTLYTTFDPCAMCGGAIMVSGVSTLVMGARNNPLDTRYGAYAVERLFELANWVDRIEVVTGVLIDECSKIRSVIRADGNFKVPVCSRRYVPGLYASQLPQQSSLFPLPLHQVELPGLRLSERVYPCRRRALPEGQSSR